MDVRDVENNFTDSLNVGVTENGIAIITTENSQIGETRMKKREIKILNIKL